MHAHETHVYKRPMRYRDTPIRDVCLPEMHTSERCISARLTDDKRVWLGCVDDLKTQLGEEWGAFSEISQDE